MTVTPRRVIVCKRVQGRPKTPVSEIVAMAIRILAVLLWGKMETGIAELRLRRLRCALGVAVWIKKSLPSQAPKSCLAIPIKQLREKPDAKG